MNHHLFAFQLGKPFKHQSSPVECVNSSPETWSPLEYDDQAQLWQGRGAGTARATTLFCTMTNPPCPVTPIYKGGNWPWQSDDPKYLCW
jgi:hypothetical protein